MTDDMIIREAVRRGIARYVKKRGRRRKKKDILRRLRRKSTGPTYWKSELMQHVADRMI